MYPVCQRSLCNIERVRPTIYEYAGGADAFARLAAAHHARCLTDDLLEHPFSHDGKPDHVRRLATYWAEVFGGPTTYSETYGGHPVMLTRHAGCEAPDEMGDAFIGCFVAAADDAELPGDTEFRAVLQNYMQWAVDEVMSYSPRGSVVPAAAAVPRWSWDGLVS
jgi:hemoglobin